MQRSTDRIYTTHVGSLARPEGLLDLMRASASGEPIQAAEFDAAQRRAVADVVQRQSGYEPRPRRGTLDKFRPEIEEFPEYYEQYFQRAMTGGMAVPAPSLACPGPVSYTGKEQLGRDLAALRDAVGDAGQ